MFGVPQKLLESASIDEASPIKIFCGIVIPISVPVDGIGFYFPVSLGLA